MKSERTIDWDDFHRRKYESQVSWCVHWLDSARDLLASAKELEPKIFEVWDSYRIAVRDSTVPLKPDHYHRPYFMLMAFAVENLFKAAIVARAPFALKQSVLSTGRLPKTLLGHDLVRLAVRANFDHTGEDEVTLRRLRRHAIWAGRYPAPVEYQNSGVSETFTSGTKQHIAWFGAGDVERLNELVNRIKREMGFDRS